MANIVLAAQNAINGVGTFYGSHEDAGFPLANLKDPVYAKAWRYTPAANANGTVARFAFGLAPIFRTNHIAFCRHNLSERAQVRVRAGAARLDADFISDTPFTHDLQFGGGTGGTYTDEYGVLKTLAVAGARYEHDRRWPINAFLWSEELNNAAWAVERAKVYPDGQTVAFAGDSNPLTPLGALLYQVINSTVYAGETYEISAYCRLLEGDGTLRARLVGTGVFGAANGTSATVRAEWGWVRWTVVAPATEPGYASVLGELEKANFLPGVIQFKRIQFSRGSANGMYRKTTTQRRYRRRGLVVEGAQTNGLRHSHDYTNAVWQKNTVTLSAAGFTLDGGASTFTSIGGTAGVSSLVQDMTGQVGNTTRALSLIFRTTGGASCTHLTLSIQWLGGAVGQQATVAFNPQMGFFISSVASGGAVIHRSGVEDIGEGFYRAFIIATGSDATNTTIRSYCTWGASGTAFVYGMQNEPNYVTSYIPTTTAAVTRPATSANVEPTTWVPYLFPTALSEATLYHEAEVNTIGIDSTPRELNYIQLFDAAGNHVFSALRSLGGSADIGTLVYNNTALVYISAPKAVTLDAITRGAIRIRGFDFKAAADGVLEGNSFGLPTQPAGFKPTAINLMASAGPTCFQRRVCIWPYGVDNTLLTTLSTQGPSAIDYDSGWEDALQAPMQGDVPSAWGRDYDVIKPFPARAVEWVRVEIYDPAKVSSATPFEIGRAFMGKMVLQPAKNASFPAEDGWGLNTGKEAAHDGRAFFSERPAIREAAFTFRRLTATEADMAHEMMGGNGISNEVLYMPDPDDKARTQRHGFVGYLSDLDRIRWPSAPVREVGFQMEQKR